MAKQQTEKQLIKILQNTRNKLDVIKDKRRKKIAKTLISKCFKYRNSYSCSKEESDRWWVYRKITHLQDSLLMCFDFELSASGEYTINPQNHIYPDYNLSDCKEISKEEFDRAWKEFLISIKQLRDNNGKA